MADNRPNDDDDDFELELEPIDPEIVAHQRARGEHVVETAVKKIDVDEVYGQSGNYSDLEVDLSQLKQFRFTTRHLLLITAILAIGLTIKETLGGCMLIFVGIIAAVTVGFFWVSRLDRQQEAERLRRREEFFANQGKPTAATPLDAPAPAAAVAAAESPPRPRFDVKFAFSMQELFITMTIAVVTMGLLHLLTPEYLAMILGLVALGGLVANAAGYEPPRMAVLAWSLLMAIYLAMGLYALTMPGGA